MVKGFGGKSPLVAILSKVSVPAKNHCGFFTNILYYETLADWNQVQSVIDKYKKESQQDSGEDHIKR